VVPAVNGVGGVQLVLAVGVAAVVGAVAALMVVVASIEADGALLMVASIVMVTVPKDDVLTASGGRSSRVLRGIRSASTTAGLDCTHIAPSAVAAAAVEGGGSVLWVTDS